MLLLLGSLSLQMAVLQGRLLLAARRERTRNSDALHSAAHRLAAALEGPYQCLRTLPSSSWQAGSLPSTCPSDLDPQPLRTSTVAGRSVELHSWEPSADGGLLRLQLPEGGQDLRVRLRLGQPGSGLQELG